MTEIKLYAERDAMELDKAGNHYCRHISAMTSEGLHSKSDIAAELGWRDLQIAQLQEQVRALAAESANIKKIAGKLVASYIMNKGAESEFISCKTLSKSRCGKGGVWDDWRNLSSAIDSTPATDAAIREIRAQGCELFIEFNRKLAKDYPTAMVAKALEVTELNGEQFAARIRAGEVQP